ncbi:MAG: 50S ribosomal protein L3 [Thermoproteota archaeon]
MGHRKQSAPRHGSLAFRPRARFRRLTPRIRFWPEVDGRVRLLGFAGYRVGMTNGFIIDTSESSPFKGKEVFTPLTLIETPPLSVVGVRLYGGTVQGLQVFWEGWASSLPEHLKRRITSLGKRKEASPPQAPENLIEKVKEVRVIVATQPYRTGIGKKAPEVFEIGVGGGGSVKERVDYAMSLLGKEVKASEALEEGSFIDVFAVTKGKGFQGVVKRFRVRIMDRKSNKTRRGIATLGPWKPAGVMYSVPRPGQMGYMQRLVRNLQVLKMVDNLEEFNSASGFHKYGVLRNPVLIVNGSVPGTPKRLVKIRVSARKHNMKIKQPPALTHISIRRPVAA